MCANKKPKCEYKTMKHKVTGYFIARICCVVVLYVPDADDVKRAKNDLVDRIQHPVVENICVRSVFNKQTQKHTKQNKISSIFFFKTDQKT